VSAERAESRASRKAAREIAIGRTLDAVQARCDHAGRRAVDPVDFVHGYKKLIDQELVALLASSLAFGNVKAFHAKIADALERIGPRVAEAADDREALAKRLAGWKHRVYRDRDLVGLLAGARRVQRRSGSLGARLREELARHGELRLALGAWVTAIRTEGGLDLPGAGRGAQHILADPSAGAG
jgi:hypothetical protein